MPPTASTYSFKHNHCAGLTGHRVVLESPLHDAVDHNIYGLQFLISLGRPVVQSYPDGCQQILLRLRPYPVRGNRLL